MEKSSALYQSPCWEKGKWLWGGFQLQQITGEVPDLWEKLGDAGLQDSSGVDTLQGQQGLCFMEPARDGAQK